MLLKLAILFMVFGSPVLFLAVWSKLGEAYFPNQPELVDALARGTLPALLALPLVWSGAIFVARRLRWISAF